VKKLLAVSAFPCGLRQELEWAERRGRHPVGSTVRSGLLSTPVDKGGDKGVRIAVCGVDHAVDDG